MKDRVGEGFGADCGALNAPLILHFMLSELLSACLCLYHIPLLNIFLLEKQIFTYPLSPLIPTPIARLLSQFHCHVTCLWKSAIESDGEQIQKPSCLSVSSNWTHSVTLSTLGMDTHTHTDTHTLNN